MTKMAIALTPAARLGGLDEALPVGAPQPRWLGAGNYFSVNANRHVAILNRSIR